LSGNAQVNFSDEEHCRWQWYRSAERVTDEAAPVSQRDTSPSPRRRRPLPPSHSNNTLPDESDTEDTDAAWEPIPGAEQRVYFPSAEDSGHRLRVECTPSRFVSFPLQVWHSHSTWSKSQLKNVKPRHILACKPIWSQDILGV
jgi:hypothetical protein